MISLKTTTVSPRKDCKKQTEVRSGSRSSNFFINDILLDFKRWAWCINVHKPEALEQFGFEDKIHKPKGKGQQNFTSRKRRKRGLVSLSFGSHRLQPSLGDGAEPWLVSPPQKSLSRLGFCGR